MYTEYEDFAPRNGSKKNILISILETLGLILMGLFIASIIGSMIYGNEGFVELLASFIV